MAEVPLWQPEDRLRVSVKARMCGCGCGGVDMLFFFCIFLFFNILSMSETNRFPRDYKGNAWSRKIQTAQTEREKQNVLPDVSCPLSRLIFF